MEKIRVAIVMTAQRLCAMKVEDDGRLETISLDGNESMKYAGESDFLEFADYIKKFYNVSELDDLDFSVVILKAGVDAEKAAQIIDIFKIVSDLYVLDAKDFESVFGEGANIFKANDAELDELKAEVGKLKDENGKLKNEVAELKAENGKMKDEVAELKDENGNLKDEVAKLQQKLDKSKNFLQVEITEPEDADLKRAYAERLHKIQVPLNMSNHMKKGSFFSHFLYYMFENNIKINTVGDLSNAMKKYYESSIHIFIKNHKLISELKKSETKIDEVMMLEKENEQLLHVFGRVPKGRINTLIPSWDVGGNGARDFQSDSKLCQSMIAIAENRSSDEDEEFVTDAIKKFNDDLDKLILNNYLASSSQNEKAKEIYLEKRNTILKSCITYLYIFSLLVISPNNFRNPLTSEHDVNEIAKKHCMGNMWFT